MGFRKGTVEMLVKIPTLILVVPCYNEEEIIEKTAAVLADKMIEVLR